jgi:uncharacterized protein (TIGR03083 family)
VSASDRSPVGAGRPAGDTPRFSHLQFCDMAGREIDALVQLVRGADLAERVPWSRRWRLEDLVHHVGAVHRWVTDLVVTDARRYRPIRDTDDWRPDTTPAKAARWLAAGRDPLLAAMAAADPNRKMWAWGTDQHVRFWSRRMTHETGVHRADAELTLGLPPAFDAELAADGVSEFLDNLWKARAWRRDMGALRGGGETIGLSATDVADRWTIRRTANGFSWTHHVAGRPPRTDVTVTAPVGDLYLFVWKRIRGDPATVKIRGDTAMLDHWLRYSSV